MQCAITGSAPVNVVWLKDNGALPKAPAHYQTLCESNKHTLEIAKLEADDRGLYVCKASNNVGTAECSAELCVIDKPTFVKPLGPVSAVVGAPLHLECQVDEVTGVTVTWTRDGRKVHQSPDCKLSFEDKTVNLYILKTTQKDCGNYVCTVTNEAGSASCSTLVKVQGKTCLIKLFGKRVEMKINLIFRFPPVVSCVSLMNAAATLLTIFCYFKIFTFTMALAHLMPLQNLQSLQRGWKPPRSGRRAALHGCSVPSKDPPNFTQPGSSTTARCLPAADMPSV